MKDEIEARLSQLGNRIDSDERFVDEVMSRIGGTEMRNRRPGGGTLLGLAAAAVVLLGLGVWLGAVLAEGGYTGAGVSPVSRGRMEPERAIPISADGLTAASPRVWIENLLSLKSGQPGDAIVGVVVAVPQQWPSDNGVVLILSSARPSDASLQAFGTPLFAAQFTRRELFEALNRPAVPSSDDEPFDALSVTAAPTPPLKELIARLAHPADQMQSPFGPPSAWD